MTVKREILWAVGWMIIQEERMRHKSQSNTLILCPGSTFSQTAYLKLVNSSKVMMSKQINKSTITRKKRKHLKKNCTKISLTRRTISLRTLLWLELKPTLKSMSTKLGILIFFLSLLVSCEKMLHIKYKEFKL